MVSLPHCEQLVRVSTRPELEPTGVAPRTDTRFALQDLHRLGSFLNCLSWKNNCYPAVKTKSAPQSIHFNILSWNSIEDAPSAHALAHPMAHWPMRQRKVRLHPPSIYPWTRPAMPWESARITAYTRKNAKITMNFHVLRKTERDQKQQGPPRGGRPSNWLILLFASLFPAALAR